MVATAVSFPMAIFGAVAVGSAVEIAVVTFLRVLGDAVATAAFNPGTVRRT
jgi:hypothetical protein